MFILNKIPFVSCVVIMNIFIKWKLQYCYITSTLILKGENNILAGFFQGTDDEYKTPGANNRNKNGRVKRPMNAFMAWARDFRGQLAASMPRATNSEISVTLGRIWASLPAEEKQYYYDLAERIKQKHRQDYPSKYFQKHYIYL